MQGKGVEIIKKLANKLPKFKFHLYGNIKTYDNYKSDTLPKNMIFKGFISYNELTKKIKKYKILLMPYQKKIGVLMRDTNVEDYFSPLKMFDYMASGKTIIASDLKVYKHILKNGINSILINPDKINLWVKSIKKMSKSSKLNYLGKNAIRDVYNYSWNLRVRKIKKFYEKNKILLTGSSGFIGFHVAENLLKNNYEIIGIDNHDGYYDPKIKIKEKKY